jgi:purine-binding chemotaxis protein CheW
MNVQNSKNASNELIQLVTFKLGNEEFGVDIFKVREINKMMAITKVPNAPSFVEGVVNLRGSVTPIIDLRCRLGLYESEVTEKTGIVVAELSDSTIGLIVDEVKEVLRIPADITEPPPEIVAGVNAEFITSVAKLEDRLLILLDLSKVLSFKEQEELVEAV